MDLWYDADSMLNQAYYHKYPEDVDAVHGLAFHIKSKGGISLPSGGTLTVRGFLTLGRAFGAHGGLDVVHDLVLRMKTDLEQFQFVTKPCVTPFPSNCSPVALLAPYGMPT